MTTNTATLEPTAPSLAVPLLQRMREHEPSMADHMRRVGALAERLLADVAPALLADDNGEAVRAGVWLHDIGKLVVSPATLRSPTGLCGHERTLLHAHPEAGAALLHADPRTRGGADVVRSHHERVDGAGYPDQLAGDQIPLAARAVAVADVFDVLTVGRAYQPPVSSDAAVDELRRVAGFQLDARLVEVFCDTIVASTATAEVR